MALVLYSFQDFVNQQVAAMQAASGIPLDFDPGSEFLAFVEANAANALALQAQATYDLAVARLTTSTGSNVDTFVNQFQLYRKDPTYAYGPVTLSRYTTTQPAKILAGDFDYELQKFNSMGDLVYSPISQITYSVVIDTTNPYYDPDQTAYVIPTNTASIDVPVVATIAGANGNVLANQINTIYSIIPNVDTVNNGDPIDTGQNQETDDELKVRFYLYINGLSKGNYDSIAAATLAVSGVKRYELIEFEDLNGNPMPGFFYDVVDDGAGNASPTLLANVQASVYATRALGVAFSIYGPEAFPINITAHVYTDGTVPDATVRDAVVAALQNYIVSQGFNATLPYSEIPRIIYEANNELSTNPFSPIINVKNYLLNGATADVAITGRNIMTVGTISVTMNA